MKKTHPILSTPPIAKIKCDRNHPLFFWTPPIKTTRPGIVILMKLLLGNVQWFVRTTFVRGAFFLLVWIAHQAFRSIVHGAV
jgi:hypothetical protein